MLPNLEVGFPLICFQRLSLPNLATEQCPWQEQLVHQRFVLSGPLVLGKTPLKQRRLQQIETNLSHACKLQSCNFYPLLPMAWTIPRSGKPEHQRVIQSLIRMNRAGNCHFDQSQPQSLRVHLKSQNMGSSGGKPLLFLSASCLSCNSLSLLIFSGELTHAPWSAPGS